jgi:hypothetical protein
MSFFQLANYGRIYQDECNTLQILRRVLAGVFSWLRNEQFEMFKTGKNSIAT